jgi:hypothetical protein
LLRPGDLVAQATPGRGMRNKVHDPQQDHLKALSDAPGTLDG